MNKPELLKKIAKDSGMSQQTVDSVLKSFVNVVVETVRDENDPITIPGLGTFKVKETTAREGRNPMNGEPAQIKASKTIAFKPLTSVKVYL